MSNICFQRMSSLGYPWLILSIEEEPPRVLIADLQEHLRKHVRATVKSRQITQSGLGELVGMKQSHISNFLLSKRGLSFEGMDAILKVLGLDVADLLSMSRQTPSMKQCSPTLESVPLVALKAAMNRTFGKSDILEQLEFTKILLRRSKVDTPEKRTAWVRFIAIRADAALAAPMHPRLANGSVLLVDRHYCSLIAHQKDEPNLYLIRKERTLMVRWIEMHGSNLLLRPDSSAHPLDFICIDRKHPLTSFIAGRVVYIGTELDIPVLGRPLLP
jgi:transcriptional regulator with XRE-family HTH domain